MQEEEIGVLGIVWSENYGSCSHRSSSLGCHFGAWVLAVDLVCGPRRRHVLRPLPADMVGISIADLFKAHHRLSK